MAVKNGENPQAAMIEEAAVEEKAPVRSKRNTKKSDGKAAGFYVYIGPSIRGVIQAGTVYRGTKADALAKIGVAAEKYPLIESLVVSGDTLAADRIKVKNPGNLLHVNYMKLVSGTM